MRVVARPCSPGAGLAGAQPALTSRPAAGTVQRGHPTGAGSRGGGAWPWLGQRGLPEGQRTRLLGTQSAQGQGRPRGLSLNLPPGQSRPKSVAQPPWYRHPERAPERCLRSPIPSACGGESSSVGTRLPPRPWNLTKGKTPSRKLLLLPAASCV